MRFRFAELLSVISVAGIALAAILKPTTFHLSVFFSLTLLLTLIACAMAIGRQKADRCFWLGFTITSFAYLVFSGALGQAPRSSGPDLPTQSLNWILNAVHRQPSGVDDPFGDGYGGGGYGGGGYGGDEDGDESADSELDDLFSESKTTNSAEFEIRLCQYGSGGRRGRRGGYGGGYGGEGGYGEGGGGYGGGGYRYPTNSFYQIGHCAWALVLAWLTGHLAQFIYKCSHSKTDTEVTARR